MKRARYLAVELLFSGEEQGTELQIRKTLQKVGIELAPWIIYKRGGVIYLVKLPENETKSRLLQTLEKILPDPVCIGKAKKFPLALPLYRKWSHKRQAWHTSVGEYIDEVRERIKQECAK